MICPPSCSHQGQPASGQRCPHMSISQAIFCSLLCWALLICHLSILHACRRHTGSGYLAAPAAGMALSWPRSLWQLWVSAPKASAWESLTQGNGDAERGLGSPTGSTMMPAVVFGEGVHVMIFWPRHAQANGYPFGPSTRLNFHLPASAPGCKEQGARLTARRPRSCEHRRAPLRAMCMEFVLVGDIARTMYVRQTTLPLFPSRHTTYVPAQITCLRFHIKP